MYGKVLSAAVIPAAIILPTTGSKVTAIIAAACIAVGTIALVTTVASAVAKRVNR